MPGLGPVAMAISNSVQEMLAFELLAFTWYRRAPARCDIPSIYVLIAHTIRGTLATLTERSPRSGSTAARSGLINMLLLEQRLRHLLEPTIAVCKDYTGPAYTYVPGLCAIFAFEFVIAYLGWGLYGLKGKKRGTLSSCFISISHGLATCTLCAYQLYTSFPFALDAWNSPGTNFVMQLSVAYMLVDMFMFLLPFTPGDYLFVGHHIMTAAYMLMSLQINRGGLSCLILMALGESTSLFQNSWLIARELRRDNQAAMSAFKLLSPIYTYLFLLVRSMIAPPTIAWFAYALQSATALPASCRYTWAAFAVVATAGSQIWSYKLYRGLRKNFAKHSEPMQEKPKAH